MLADAVVRANSEATQKQREQAADGGKPADVGGGVVDEARKLLSAAIV